MFSSQRTPGSSVINYWKGLLNYLWLAIDHFGSWDSWLKSISLFHIADHKRNSPMSKWRNMDVLLQGNLWPYDWIQSCFGWHIKGFFWAADWPDWRQSIESAEWVKSHRPAPNPLCFSQGGAPRMKTRLVAPHTAWRIRLRGRSLSFSPLLRICKRDTARKSCFRTSLDSALIGVTGNSEGLHSQSCRLQCSSEKERKIRLVALWEAVRGWGML